MTLQKVTKALILSVILCLLLSCSYLGKSENEKLISEKEEYYSIDPYTLINAINQGGQANLFSLRKPFADQSGMWLLPEEKTVFWEQSDYYQIAQALNKYIGNEPLENWNIKMIYLSNDCNDTGLGFTRGSFKFFKINQSEQSETRDVLTVDILPWRKIIRWYEVEYSPISENWGSLEIKKLNISSRQAIEIAEKYGGSRIRSKIANECFVTTSIIAPGSAYGGWTVSYSIINKYSTLENIFQVLIDPSDGKIQSLPSQ